MLQIILLVLLGLLGLCLIIFIIKPLVELLLLKLKYGEEIDIEFMPILGEAFYLNRAQSQYKDYLYHKRNILQRKPGVKILASNFFFDKIVLTLVDPLLIKQFLQAPEQYTKLNFLLFGDLTLNKGLVLVEDNIWKDQRKIISHQFTFENLKQRFPIIKEITKQILSQSIKIDQDIQLLSVTSKITGEVMTQTFFGKEFSNKLINGLSLTDAAVQYLTIQFALTFKRVWPHLRGIFYGYRSDIPQYLLTSEEKDLLCKLNSFHQFIHNGIDRRVSEFKNNQSCPNQDFIQLYLEESRNYDKSNCKEELIHQFITFAFAGTDTTSTLTTMACYVLSQKQDLQKELRSHIKEHIESFDNLAYSDLQKLDKLNAFCQEVLRVYPPASRIGFRRAKQQLNLGRIIIFKLGSFSIKPSHLIACGILTVQQSPKYYDKPEEFNINRWLTNNIKDPHAFVAFSSGPRNCIGQHMALIEAKIMLIYFLLNYRLIPDPRRELEMTLDPLYVAVDDRLVHFQLL